MSDHFSYMTALPSTPTDEPQVTFESGYKRSECRRWTLLYEPFLAAMADNMSIGERHDGKGSRPNYLKAIPADDKYTLDHLREHLHKAMTGDDVGHNLVAVACNAMILYHQLQERECASK